MIRAIKDFYYNKHSLSDFGLMIDDGGSLEDKTIDRGGTITTKTIKSQDGKLLFPIKSEYDNTITANFKIVKDPTNILNNLADDYSINEDDARIIYNWLDSPIYNRICFESEDMSYLMDARFNLKRIETAGKLYGFDCTLITLSPFAYGNMIKKAIHAYDIDKKFIMLIDSDEFGIIYPQVEITANRAGNFILTNETTGAEFRLNNVAQYEQFGQRENQILTLSENSNHTPYDFNYEFFNLRNLPFESKNVFTVNIPCDITIGYIPRYRGVI